MRYFIIFSVLIGMGMANKDGAPDKICDSADMIPEHGPDKTPQTSTPPFTVKASSLQYTPGQNITVTIEGKNTKFRGFAVVGLEGGKKIGKWQPVPGESQQLKSCPIITHVKNDDKPSVTLTWTAPDNSGTVNFMATIVETGYVFWIKVPATQG